MRRLSGVVVGARDVLRTVDGDISASDLIAGCTGVSLEMAEVCVTETWGPQVDSVGDVGSHGDKNVSGLEVRRAHPLAADNEDGGTRVGVSGQGEGRTGWFESPGADNVCRSFVPDVSW